ncbi:MAG: prephenate dehydrogenase [Syntrophomonadaceae bacterium]|nr:prephenate dehydrogenase [Syntrophomonadaceae bacterium]
MRARVAIIGLGLIGGSLGMAFSNSEQVELIYGFDSDSETVQRALEMEAIHCTGTLEAVVQDADFVFICTPLKSVKGVIPSIAAYLKPGCVVTDVSSTKEQVMRLLSELPVGVHGIGGHPMAGSEKHGIGAADRYLFENAVYVLTPVVGTPLEVLAALSALVEETGARVKVMDAEQHDRVVALISHLPHILAMSLVNLVAQEEDALLLAAGGFRDTTRIASSNPELWEDILFSNREKVSQGLDAIIQELSQLKEELDTLQRKAVRLRLDSARQVRDSIPQRRKGLIPEFQDVITVVPDRPGIIGQLGGWLGSHGINIVDIEILRAREGDGGTIRLGVPTKQEALRAVSILHEQGIKAWMS